MKSEFMPFKNRIWTAAGYLAMSFLLLSMSAQQGLISAAWAGEQKVVAKVNDKALTEADVQRAINEIIPRSLFHREITAQKRESFRQEAIEKIIRDELLYQGAQDMGLQADEAKVNEKRQDAIDRLGGNKRFKQALDKAGLTDEQYREIIRRKLQVEKILKQEVEDKAIVSDEEVEAYYKKHKESYVRPEARRVMHILIQVDPNASADEKKARRRRAEEVLRKIKEGGDMAQLAWEYSDDAFRVKSGDMGLLHRGRLMPQLEEVAFKLKVGEVSRIVETIYGYHILRVDEIRDPEQLSLDDVSKQIKKDLTLKREQQLETELIERLRAKARVEVY